MYEGYLQHDAQEVMQCILGYLHEACDALKKQQELEKETNTDPKIKQEIQEKASTEDDGQVNGKRKSDTEAGNAKKKPKSVKSKGSDDEEEPSGSSIQTRSKRKSSSDTPIESVQCKIEGQETMTAERNPEDENEGDKPAKETDVKRKKRARLGWLRPSRKQPSIFSKFRSVGRISSTTAKNQDTVEAEDKSEESVDKKSKETALEKCEEDSAKTHGMKHIKVSLY